MFCFISELSDCLLICICIWTLTVHLAIAKPVPNESEMQAQSLETKLRYPCGVNGDATKEDLSPSDIKKMFEVIHLQSKTALFHAEISLRNFVSTTFTRFELIQMQNACCACQCRCILYAIDVVLCDSCQSIAIYRILT